MANNVHHLIKGFGSADDRVDTGTQAFSLSTRGGAVADH